MPDESPPHATPSDATPLPRAESTGADPRMVGVWRAWLGKLATDAEAALAAAMAYMELDGAGRDEWIAALEHDVRALEVPAIAVWAPLLAVEADPQRRARITQALGSEGLGAVSGERPRALAGEGVSGLRVAVIVAPLYLEFVRVLACGFRVQEGFEWVRHDPIVDRRNAPRSGARLGGAVLEATPLKPLVDDLAVTVLSHGRRGRELPEALRIFADLFEPTLEVAAEVR